MNAGGVGSVLEMHPGDFPVRSGNDAADGNALIDDPAIPFNDAVGYDRAVEESPDPLRRHTISTPVPVGEMIETDKGEKIR
jgi:hypothetical protein